MFVHRKLPLQIQKLHKTSLNRQRRFSKTSGKMLCKLISNTKHIMIGKQTSQNSKKRIRSLYFSRKQMTKGVNFLLQTFAGSGHIILKRCYPTIIIWYAKQALTRRKLYIERGCDNSHPANRYQTYQSHNVSGNQTQKLSLHKMINTPGSGSVNMMSEFLTAITIIWQHPVHPNLQYEPNSS